MFCISDRASIFANRYYIFAVKNPNTFLEKIGTIINLTRDNKKSSLTMLTSHMRRCFTAKKRSHAASISRLCPYLLVLVLNRQYLFHILGFVYVLKTEQRGLGSHCLLFRTCREFEREITRPSHCACADHYGWLPGLTPT